MFANPSVLPTVLLTVLPSVLGPSVGCFDYPDFSANCFTYCFTNCFTNYFTNYFINCFTYNPGPSVGFSLMGGGGNSASSGGMKSGRKLAKMGWEQTKIAGSGALRGIIEVSVIREGN